MKNLLTNSFEPASANPMRIMIISDAWQPQINGVVRTYENLSHHLNAAGHDVQVVGPRDFRHVPLPFYNEIDLALFPKRRLERMIKDFKPDHIHIAVEGPLGRAAQKICHKNGYDYTTCYHSHFPDYIAKRCAWLGKKVAAIVRNVVISDLRKFHARARTVFVATQSLEDTLREWGFKAPMTRLLRGVDTAVFHPPANDVQRPGDKPTLLYVGRVATEKNIRAFLDLDIDAHKIVVGGGPELDTLKKHYTKVEFAGYQTGKALADYYRKADVFVFPSRTDTFGMVLIEALACGAPIAGYDVTGPKDIVDRPLLGAVSHDLHAAVTAALRDRGRFSRQDRFDYICANYTWPAVAAVFAGGVAPREKPALRPR